MDPDLKTVRHDPAVGLLAGVASSLLVLIALWALAFR
jgi:hypothetical protein